MTSETEIHTRTTPIAASILTTYKRLEQFTSDSSGLIYCGENKRKRSRKKIQEILTQQRLRWKFNPTAKPHSRSMERLDRNCKKEVYLLIDNRSANRGRSVHDVYCGANFECQIVDTTPL